MLCYSGESHPVPREQGPTSSRGSVTYDDENETDSSSEAEEESHAKEAQLPAG